MGGADIITSSTADIRAEAGERLRFSPRMVSTDPERHSLPGRAGTSTTPAGAPGFKSLEAGAPTIPPNLSDSEGFDIGLIWAKPKLRVLDLFSGIGGFSLGLERTGGFQTVAFCEIEPFPRKVLAKHWPGVPIYDDVCTLTASRLAGDGIDNIDCITGGFPCQDLSFAGKMAGISAERSGLWSEIVRLAGELRPRFILVENVTALLAGERGRWFGRVLGDLAALGYDAEWHSIPASTVGAPHRRDRVWIVANARQVECETAGVSASVEGGKERARRTPLENGDFYRLVRGVPCGVADDWWRAQSRLARSCDGIPDRLDRLATLGNTVVPAIPELIGRAILQSLNDAGSDCPDGLCPAAPVSKPFHDHSTSAGAQ